MVHLKETQNMFWALVLEEGKRYSQTVEQSFHISMAALEVPTDAESHKGKQSVSVMVASQKSEFLICNLNAKHVNQQTLDLNFNEGEEVTFFINGQGTVHLTGYQLEDGELSDMDDFDDLEGESDTEVPELVPAKKRKKQTEAEVPKKKAKWLTPGGNEYSDDSDDDSDDADSEEDVANPICLLDLEVGSGDSDDDYELDDEDMEEDDDDDDDEDDDDDSGEESDDEMEVPQKKQKPAQNKGKETPKADKNKQTAKQDQIKTPKQSEAKTPQQNKTQDKKVQGQKPGQTPVSTPGAGGDAGTESSKKKKKRKKKKNQDLENGAGGQQQQQQGAKTPQAQQQQGAKTPQQQQKQQQGAKTPQQQQKQQQGGKTPQSNTPKPSQGQQTPGKTPKKQVLAGGILAEDIVTGDGPQVKKGKMAHVYYVGKLQKDGKQFDSCTSGKPFRFKLGKGEVIQGWDKGVEGMKIGGKRRLTVPPQQGYGNTRQGPIPPNSTLVFEVELKHFS